MFTARVASEPGGTKCDTARKSWCAALTVLTPSPVGSCPGVRVPRGTFREHACWMSGSRSLEASGR
eukprot:3304509-Prymnesium_polylepis.1